jgi:hypothetical protein
MLVLVNNKEAKLIKPSSIKAELKSKGKSLFP